MIKNALPQSGYKVSNHLRLSRRIEPHFRTFIQIRSLASRNTITDKSRILEKPTRFNPPSHGSRRVRPRQYPGAPLSEQELEAQKTKRYPNMMPPEGSLMYRWLTNRRIHMWTALAILSFLSIYSFSQSFLHTTIYRHDLPYWSDLLSHPFQAISQFWGVYKLHVAYESEKVAEKRRQKIADATKRKEFLREHGVEPGFLTGSWMEKFGTVEGDKWREQREAASRKEVDLQSPMHRESDVTAVTVAGDGGANLSQENLPEQQQAPHTKPEKKKVKMWLGIW